MDPIDFILKLQKQNRRSLQILSPAYVRYFVVRNNFFLTIRDEQKTDVGYLIHSRPRPGCGIYLNQICIAKHARGRGHARRLIQMLIIRCRSYDNTAIITTCPAHLQAADFFPHLGFDQTAHRRAPKTLTRYINHYLMAIEPNPTPQDAPKRAQSLFTGYPRMLDVDAYRRLYGLPSNQKIHD